MKTPDNGTILAVWHTQSIADVENRLTVPDGGLTDEEAAVRLEQYGLNEVEAEQEVPWWSLLLYQFRDPLIYVLLVAAAVTLVLRDFTDTGVILAVVIINAVIGYVQEHRAQQAMHALARLSAPRAEVVRGGRSQTLPSRELVGIWQSRYGANCRNDANGRLSVLPCIQLSITRPVDPHHPAAVEPISVCQHRCCRDSAPGRTPPSCASGHFPDCAS